MSQARKNSLLALAILLAIISMPMHWLTINSLPSESESQTNLFDGISNESVFGGTIAGRRFTALDDWSLTFLSFPICAVPIVAVLSSLAQLMAATRFFDVPLWFLWPLSVFSALIVVWIIVMPIFNEHLSSGVGPLVTLLSSAIPITMLLTPTKMVPSVSS